MPGVHQGEDFPAFLPADDLMFFSNQLKKYNW
jgi:hypothetical protein